MLDDDLLFFSQIKSPIQLLKLNTLDFFFGFDSIRTELQSLVTTSSSAMLCRDWLWSGSTGKYLVKWAVFLIEIDMIRAWKVRGFCSLNRKGLVWYLNYRKTKKRYVCDVNMRGYWRWELLLVSVSTCLSQNIRAEAADYESFACDSNQTIM